MKEEQELIAVTGSLVKKDFEIELNDPNFITEAMLETALADRIFELIEHDLEKLFAILYRLDISERKVHAALQPNTAIAPNIAIARLIIARQKEKAATRLKYRQMEEDEDAEKW